MNTKWPVIQFLRILISAYLAVGLLATPTTAWTQSYPIKPLHLVVPFPPGAGTDMFARAIAAKLNDSLGHPVVVDNKPGAGATIGTDFVAKAAPDGYTLLLSTSSHAINPAVYSRLPYDTLKDFTTITQVANVPTVLVVHSSVPANSLKELVALAKAKPGTLNMGSSGTGTVFHLAGELLKSMAGIDMVHVPFKGGSPALAALVGGQIQVLFETTLTVQPQIKAGRIRALAIGGARRSASMPDVPTVAESDFPGFAADNWYGVYVPAGTPSDIVARLNQEIVKALNLPDVKERFTAQGADIVANTPEQHLAFLKAEIEKWAKIAKLSNAKAD
jgi:tripartite-type tricarboxylate transporter receptor subunit TctC